MSKTVLSSSDEWETPKDLYDMLCKKYKLHPTLDVAATHDNSKCQGILLDGLRDSWKPNLAVETVWCNPPHSKTEKFVRKADEQWRIYNINIMMIIPANSICTNYADECIGLHAEYHPINRKWCMFLHKGEYIDHSRNGYFVVIWRKRLDN